MPSSIFHKHAVTTILLIVFISSMHGEVIYEYGSILEFIGGNSSTTAYDNYISHVSEGIVSPGYNDYGPDTLDVQNNDFGDYRIIPPDSPILDYWRAIFGELINNNIQSVDVLLTDSLSSFNYDIVHFVDTVFTRSYYLIRERLDSNYYDENMIVNPDDDVAGSFRNGWGLYLISPSASRSNLLIEVPHPCDDFIAPYFATELFTQCDAFALAIAGAGREVRWTGIPPYNNGKSRSDPSRNANSVFQIFHEVISDSLIQIGPHSPLVLHTHSFDNSHTDFKSIVLSAGVYQPNANKPIRDITADNLDFVNFTMEYPIAENTFGVHTPVHVTDYFQIHYSGEFYYHGQDADYELPHSYELLGPYNGVQMVYSQLNHYSASVYEPWVQIELDEKPELFDQMNLPLSELYAGDYPTSYRNYSILLDYYQPFISAINSYLTNWETILDTIPPADILPFYPSVVEPNSIKLHWNPVDDTNFKTYRIVFDEDSITSNFHFWDNSTYAGLANMRRDNVVITGLVADLDYEFKISAEDHFGNSNQLSNPAYNYIPGHSTPIIIADFDSGGINLVPYPNEDNHPNAWTIDTSNVAENSTHSLKLTGNTWKVLAIDSPVISENSVWLTSAYIAQISEIQGIGIMDSLNVLFYSFAGTQEVDPEEWIPVYQGFFEEENWATYHLPVGHDWFAFFDYLPHLTHIVFINDQDEGTPGTVYFDNIIDVTGDLSIPPQLSISYSRGSLFRDSNNNRSIDISFSAVINDIDSYIHDYYWSFGDGSHSSDISPVHTYNIEDDHEYTVMLEVCDETDLWGRAVINVDVDPGITQFPIKLNFVGDIMLARDYEDDGGIIASNGVESIFEPTLAILGEAADITVVNLECPLTDQGTEHPTKSVTFRGSPANAAGLDYAGVDIVSLANNHTLDFGLEGLQQTQSVLTDKGILHSGAGVNSYAAEQPVFSSVAGVNIAFFSVSDRTGQYNNSQPYLQAGLNKPGFAYMTPYNIIQQIESVRDVADLIVFEMHAGSEYSVTPGSGYDVGAFPDDIAPDEQFSRTSNYGITEYMLTGDEDYSPRINVPHMWDRAIRQFAIDNGADLVIVHHPHKIQGIEVYNGKVIAHSLGNFVFDLDYPETYPSMILNTEIDYQGFTNFTITPVYIDDYIPVPATGELALHILNYLAHRSRQLDTYLFINRENNQAIVQLDTLNMERNTVLCQLVAGTENRGDYWLTAPLPLPRAGSISVIENIIPAGNWQYRLGRENIWHGNFEAEGATNWYLNDNEESMTDSIARFGLRSLLHHYPTPGNSIVTRLEDRCTLESDSAYTIHGHMRSDNIGDGDLEIRYYSSRTSTFTIGTENTTSIDTNEEWQYFYKDLSVPSNTNYFNLYLNSTAPNTGSGKIWFDDVGLIEWSVWKDFENYSTIINPNDNYFVQVRSTDLADSITINFREHIYGPVDPVSPDFTSNQRMGQLPLTVQFYNNSSGATGRWLWEFGDGQISYDQNPIHVYTTPGTFTVKLWVSDYDNQQLIESKQNYILVTSDTPPSTGDINNDNSVNHLDVLLCSQLIFGQISATTSQFIAADVNFDLQIDILDLLGIVDLIQ